MIMILHLRVPMNHHAPQVACLGQQPQPVRAIFGIGEEVAPFQAAPGHMVPSTSPLNAQRSSHRVVLPHDPTFCQATLLNVETQHLCTQVPPITNPPVTARAFQAKSAEYRHDQPVRLGGSKKMVRSAELCCAVDRT